MILKGYQQIVKNGREARVLLLSEFLIASNFAGIVFGTAGVRSRSRHLVSPGRKIPPKPLHAYGVTPENLPKFTQSVMQTQCHPMSNSFTPLDEFRVLKIYRDLY